ncbi:MAG: MCE family protein [Candidatus Stahlbacteria bacterium]|nr:MCE family protein [Candidatus Stahlbacteria bacterium]
MNKTIRAGIFVTVIVIILIVAWVWLANVKIRGNSQGVIIRFSDVSGLKINDPVKIRGVEKGSVKSIEFRQDYIEVKILIDPKITLYSDARAEILDVAMISGTKYVALDVGHSDILLSKNTIIPGKASLGIPLSMIGDLGDKAGKILSVIETAELMQSISAILHNLEETTAQLSRVVSDNQSDIKATTKTLRESSVTLKELGTKLSITTTKADSLISGIKNGEGTIGKLVTDDSLYQEFTSTLTALRELAEDIKANPRKYIKIF